ncbi:contractile injection system protein, VgrG/Pvc8 family [Paenibacillus alvei]|uniref:contractile injection system protein, VgrG/Pvc8 family n=1 Tax=Paenibacillus alvei TaxID=44250 RepID=UPI00227E71C5|nr:contractile injection system protein, VgrG/Pvc8 family [Paenibacillus alvei]
MDVNVTEKTVSYADIILISPYDIQTITELHITQRFNEHAKLHLTAIVKEESADSCIGMATTQDNICVQQKLPDGQVRTLFQGLPSHLEIRAVHGIYYLELEALSYTWNMDILRRKRSFQNPNLLYADLVESVIAPYTRADVIDLASGTTQLEHMVLQYEETDWQFLKRMASHFGAVLLAEPTATAPKFWFGLPDGRAGIPLSYAHYRIKKNLSAHSSITANSLAQGAIEKDFISYTMETAQYFRLGDRIVLDGVEQVVGQSRATLREGIWSYEYVMMNEQGIRQLPIYNERIAGAVLSGTIIGINKDKVRLHLHVDAEQEREEASWFPYSIVYAAEGNSGWHCMPELRDNVKLYFPSRYEKEAVVINSLSTREISFEPEDPRFKYMGIASGKEMKLSDEEFMLSAHGGGIFIKLHDEKGIDLHSKSNLSLLTDNNIELASKRKLDIRAEEAIYLLCGTSSILLDGQSDLLASSVQLEGSEQASTVTNDDEVEERDKKMAVRHEENIAPNEQSKEKDPAWLLNAVQLGLDVVGVIPIIGNTPKLMDSTSSMDRGKGAKEALTLAAAFPVAGPMIKGAQFVMQATAIIPQAMKKATKEEDYGMLSHNFQVASKYADEGDWINAARSVTGTIGLRMETTGSRHVLTDDSENKSNAIERRISNIKNDMGNARFR